jgi:hypothetical protein
MVDDIDAAGRNRGNPEGAFGVDLQAVGYVPVRHLWMTFFKPSGVRRTTFNV